LLVLFGLVYLVQFLVGVDESIFKAGLIKPLTRNGEFWRLLTAPLMHGSLRHLWMNVTAALFFGLLVELYGGQWLLLPLFCLSAMGGSLASLWLLSAPSVGASGGIVGFLGFLLVAWLRRRRSQPKDFGVDLAKAIIPTALIGLIGWRQIDNAAHLGGFMTGAIVGLVCFVPSEGKLPIPKTSFAVSLDRLSQFCIACAASWTLFALIR
jgi:membrane associated rhomboid family serine protease